VLTLGAGDTISIGGTKPATLTFSGAFTTGANNLINADGLTSDLNLVTIGALTVGADSIVKANATSIAAVSIGIGSTLSGNLTTASTNATPNVTGVVTLAANSSVGGYILTDGGGVNVGIAGSVGGDITTKAGVGTLGRDVIVGGGISTVAGAVNVGIAGSIGGAITSRDGVVTLGRDVIVGGGISTVAGAVNVGIAGSIGGAITSRDGVVTLGADAEVRGGISTVAGAINVGDGSRSVGGGITSEAGVVTLTTNVRIDGDIRTIAGAITIGAGSSTCGSVITTGAGVVTLGANVIIGGSISTVAGAITVGAGSTIRGDVTPSGAGVVTLTGVLVGGDVISRDGAITVTDSRVGGSVFTTGEGGVTLTNSAVNDLTLVVPPSPACFLCWTIRITPAVLPGATMSAAYSQTLVASGGNGPYTWALTNGTLPAGLTLSASTGAITGTPTASNGVGVSLIFTATDSLGCQGTTSLVLQSCPVLSLSPVTLSSAMVGTAYSQTLTASGGALPYTFALASGILPSGLSLNASTGEISGTPISTTSAAFTIRATDANSCSVTRADSLAPLPNTDFGDYSAFGSASSTFNSTLKLGATVDTEVAQTANTIAAGDDITGEDDEDGVTVPASLTAGAASSMTVNVTNTSGASAFLNVWIDYNGNGVLTDAGEQVASNTIISNGSSNSNRTVSFTVPAIIVPGTVGVRVRLTSNSSPGPTGSSGNGEVEDNVTTLLASTDFGDYNAFGSASSLMQNTLRIGDLVDAEATATTTAAATGDDITGIDDEDGVTLPTVITQSTTDSLTVNVTNTSGTSAYLNAWIDFNRNGLLTDAGEQIATNTVIVTGTSNSNRTVSFAVPATASLGTAGVRVRLTSTSNPGSIGTSGNGEVEDYVTAIAAPTKDYGDFNGFAGASSAASNNLRMGALVDVEGTAITNSAASGDDTQGVDDEDGVVFPSMTAGQPVTLPVNVTNTNGTVAYLNAWIDFNNNGALTDPGEQIATNLPIANGTNNATQNISFTVPTDAITAATNLGARLRLTSTINPGSTGDSGIGEVEDHAVVILAPLTDFGDFSGAGDVSNTASSKIRLGTLVDTEYASTRNADATGDDITGDDDEDGATLPAMIAGAPATIAVIVTNTTGSSGYLNAWIDFNNNGVFTDTGEQITVNKVVSNGTSNSTVSLPITVPANAVTGVNLGARFRITSDVSPGATGAGGVGEVEDYVINIAAPTTDFGDYSLLGSASNTVVTGLRLGALVDTEYAATTNTAATGDDITGLADEDSTTLPAMVAGAPAVIPVVVTNTTGSTANLNLWIDFNGNGVLTDAGEQIATNVSLANGLSNSTRNISFTVPATTLTGVNLGVRVRLTSAASPGATGTGGAGEVEDYFVNITAPTTDFGDFSGFADASQGVSPSLRMGASIDAEYTSTKDATATGDDNTGIDDEDGVTLSTMTTGQTVTIPVVVTNSTGALGYLNAWIDYNNNGLLTDAGEQIATNVNIPSGSNTTTFNLNVTVPVSAVTGTNLGARFRLSAPTSPGPTGANAAVGEIEDYVVNIAVPTLDFGDHSGLAAASSTANADLVMGATVDVEFAAATNATATGDDITGIDDEDGATVPASVMPGDAVTMPVTVQNKTGANAWLHAWVDFNNDGVLNDATISNGGERLESARLITSTNRGIILREYWTGISGTSVANLTSHPNYPNNPTSYDYRNDFTAPVDWADNMGQRMRGWVYPPVSGEYTFWVSGDDETQLFLSTDESVANATMIARVPGWTPSLQWTKYTEQKSVKITLEAGRPYYIEGIMKEGGGGDSIAAAWELPGTSTGPVVISGQYLSPWSLTPPTGSTQQISFTVPLTASVGANRAVRFRLTNSAATSPVGSSGVGEVEDYVTYILSPTVDFGDWSGAADASNSSTDNLRLGALVDAEFSATKNANATGDDITGVDDEDGVTLPAMTAGGTFTIPVLVTNTSGAAAFLNAWIDLNNNGSFADAGEQFAINTAVANGANNVTVNTSLAVPIAAVTGVNLGLRFRLTAAGSPGATGSGGGNGEVEDYVANITAPTTDFGDFSAFAAASSTASNNLRMGVLVDAEYVATTNNTATGDDLTNLADEDGVVLPAMTAGQTLTIPVVVTNTSGAPGYLNAWIDFNNNGVLTNAGEQVAANVLVATGSSNVTTNLTVSVPTNAVVGPNLGVRVRLTSTATPGPTGASGVGEVEDYVTKIAAPLLDYGDWSGSADAASTASNSLRLGALVDAEYAATRNGTATGDDITNLADEDGVTVPSMTAGAPATIPVVVTNTSGATAYLNVWIDFNNNGSFAEPGEQIVTNTTIANGLSNAAQNLNITVPADAATGASIGLRFRLTSVPTPGETGIAGTGEVEDYVATIAVPTTDFGDWNGAADASSLASSNLRMGSLADTEYVSTRNATATGDDITGSDDEDGVTLSAYPPGAAASAAVVVTNNSGAPGYLNAWIDFNNNGSFAEPGEQIATNISVATGTNGVTQTVSFSVPVGAVPGQRGARFRFTSTQTPTPVGASGMGEVEDYLATIHCPVITVSPATLPNPAVSTAYSQTITAGGGNGGYTFAVTSGALPAWATLNPSSGVISGTPGTNASATFTISVTDVYACVASRSYTITPTCPTFSIAPATAVTGTVGSAYSQTLTASGGVGPYAAWTVIAGALPAGLTLNASSGVISGTPTTANGGGTSLTVRVTDSRGCQATGVIALKTCPVVTVTPASLPTSTSGSSYSQVISGSGGTGPYVFAVSSGVLPAGLSLNTSTGLLSGTPTSTSTVVFTLRATDANGCAGTRNFVVTPACPQITVTPASLPTAQVNTPYSQTVAASGGDAPHTFAVSSGSLPAGLSLNTSTGVISGSITSSATVTFTIRATAADGCVGSTSYTITPTCPTISLAPAALPTGSLGYPYSETLTASGSTAPYTYMLQSGALPSGLVLASNGILNGAPSATGTFVFTIQVTDASGCTNSFPYTLLVGRLTLGNQIFEDSNNNGSKDAGEPGIAGALVQLFTPGSDNAIGGSDSAADTQIGSDFVTNSTGTYAFTGLSNGNYYVKVTPPGSFFITGGTPVTVDNDIDNNNDGSQPGGPGTPSFSPIINLSASAESTTDGDTNPDTNLTVDFGFWSSLAVGNYVFLDVNGDGVLNPGERLEDVLIFLYAQGASPGATPPVSAALSDSKGRYFIENLNPGSYFLHVPASQFAAGMPLEGLLPMATVVAGDDDAGQDLIFNNNPAVNGVSTGVFALRTGLAPTGSAESGADGGMDDEDDGRVDLTRDLGFVAPSGSGFAAGTSAKRDLAAEPVDAAPAPAGTFALWRQNNAMRDAGDDPDADSLANLLEYALGTDPLSGIATNRFDLAQDSTGGLVARLTLPVSTPDDIVLRLETLTDLTQAAEPAAWQRLAMAASTRFNADGTLTRQYAGLERLLVFAGKNTGFLRLKVELDADRNGTPEATATSAIHAWSRQTFPIGTRSFSMPLLRPAVFSGRVTAVSGREITLPVTLTLPAGSHYLEVMDGALAGQRFEIDAAVSSGNNITLDSTTSLSGLAGSRIAIRTHWMLADLLPPAAFTAADRLLFFNTAASTFITFTHEDDAWTEDALSMNARPFTADAAALVTVHGADSSLLFTGEVRSGSFTTPLTAGTQLIGSGWPAPVALPTTGLRAGSTPATADRLRLWNGDTAPELNSYTSYYLDSSTTPPSWQLQDTVPTALSPAAQPFHGIFLIRETPLLLRQATP